MVVAIIVISLIVVILITSLQYKDSVVVNSLVNQTNNAESYTTTNTTITPLKKTYINSESTFKYEYPSTWAFSSGRDGMGLYPLDDANYLSGNFEMITIFSATSNATPEEWSRSYNGSGYKIEKSININEYDGYYILKESDKIDQEIYVLSNKGIIVQAVFRRQQRVESVNIDNSSYRQVFEEIVKSIKFLN